MLFVAAGVMTVLTGLLWAFQRRLIYLPDSSAPAQGALDAEAVTLRTEDGIELGAWYLPAVGGACTVLVANGNAANRGARTGLAAALYGKGFGVLLFDYRGYGGNAGSPSETGLRLDARAAYRFLTDEAGIPPDRLLYFGESLGAAVVTGLARSHPPAGMLLRSPFTELADVAAEHYPFLPVRLLLRDRYPVAEQVRAMDLPITVLYGTADSVVPGALSQSVADSAADAGVVVIDGADHNDPALVDGPQVVDALVALAQRAGCG